MVVSRLQVASAMRVQDSLQTGTSHFMAELKRIRLVVELAQKHARGSAPVLALLDEILHGTNSHDRLLGLYVFKILNVGLDHIAIKRRLKIGVGKSVFCTL